MHIPPAAQNPIGAGEVLASGGGWSAGLATPSPSMTVDPDVVTPGFIGFVAIALIAIVVVFLIIDMLRRIRRAGYRADINEQLDAEAEAELNRREDEAAAAPVTDHDASDDTDADGPAAR
ncbi:hypothetical protein [Microbacterium flavum]